MLTQLSFQNYRTFERPETVDLRPLTVLIGRNSSGKSAIARLPLLLERGLSGNAEVPLALEFDGHDFGASFADLVTNRLTTRGITLGVKGRSDEHDTPFELRVTVGYWPEYQLQAIRQYRYYWEGQVRYDLEWDGASDPNQQMLYRDHKSGQVQELSFAGLMPIFTNMMERVDFPVVRYLGPFRDAPARDERIPEGSTFEVGPRGGNAARVLASDWIRRGGKVLQQVGQWYREHLGGWQLDLERDGQRFAVVLRSPHEQSVTVNLRDAGVGLSQVLPVVVQHELDRAGVAHDLLPGVSTLNIIEQPELHLHPGAHGALADLYLEAIGRDAGQFLIETHSENFLLRIRRRIAEGTFSADDVALYWVNDDLAATPRVRRIHIDSQGEVDFWPRGVFSEDLEEVKAIRAAQRGRAP